MAAFSSCARIELASCAGIRERCHARSGIGAGENRTDLAHPPNLGLPPGLFIPVNPRVQFGNVCLIGLGLLGGSLGLALKRRCAATRVTGYARRETTVREEKEKVTGSLLPRCRASDSAGEEQCGHYPIGE